MKINMLERMSRPRLLAASLLVWAGVWVFWLALTRDFHPTFPLAVIVTTSLVTVYAVAAYVNHLVLVPRLWSAGHRWRYAVWLGITMAVLTAGALTVIRVSYLELWGPDADPNGVYKHYAIDLFGMAVHLIVAAVVVRAVGRYRRAAAVRTPDAEPGAAPDGRGM
jgi:hypothetical protein